jgi:hypothetical protein
MKISDIPRDKWLICFYTYEGHLFFLKDKYISAIVYNAKLYDSMMGATLNCVEDDFVMFTNDLIYHLKCITSGNYADDLEDDVKKSKALVRLADYYE